MFSATSTSPFFGAQSINRPPPPSGEDIVDALDQDGNGSVTTTEAEESEAGLRFFDQFRDIDGNEDGVLTPTELDDFGETLTNGRGDRPEGPGGHGGPPPGGGADGREAPGGMDSAALVLSLFEAAQEASGNSTASVAQTGYSDILDLLTNAA